MEISDGECDMDFPGESMGGVSFLALERGGVLRNFFDDDEQNFCLVQVPDYVPRAGMRFVRELTLANTPASADEKVDIQLVFDDEVFTIEVPAMTTCRQLLNEARHRLVPGRVRIGLCLHPRSMN